MNVAIDAGEEVGGIDREHGAGVGTQVDRLAEARRELLHLQPRVQRGQHAVGREGDAEVEVAGRRRRHTALGRDRDAIAREDERRLDGVVGLAVEG